MCCFWTGIASKCVRQTRSRRQLWQHFSPSVERFQRERRAEAHPGKVVFTGPVGAKQTGGGAQRWDAVTEEEFWGDGEQVLGGKVAKENREALPELANVTERYVFFF